MFWSLIQKSKCLFSIWIGFQATSTGTHYQQSLDKQDVLKSYQNMLSCDKKFPFKSKLGSQVVI